MANYSSNSIGFLAELNAPAPAAVAAEAANSAYPADYVEDLLNYNALLEKEVLKLRAFIKAKMAHAN